MLRRSDLRPGTVAVGTAHRDGKPLERAVRSPFVRVAIRCAPGLRLLSCSGLRNLPFNMHSANGTVQFLPEDFALLRNLIEEVIENRCKNDTSAVIKELRSLLQRENATSTEVEESSSEDSLAVVYIVFVLMFFAASLLVIIIKYLRRERESSRLQQFYEDYLQNKYPSLVVHYDETGRRLHPQQSFDSTRYSSPPPTPLVSPVTTPSVTPIATPMLTPTDSPLESPL